MGRGETVILVMLDRMKERRCRDRAVLLYLPKAPLCMAAKPGFKLYLTGEPALPVMSPQASNTPEKKRLISRYYAATSYKASDKAKRANQETAYAN